VHGTVVHGTVMHDTVVYDTVMHRGLEPFFLSFSTEVGISVVAALCYT